MSLNKKLAEVQQNLKAPKGQTNKFGGYQYRSCEDILEAVKPLLGDLTLTISDEVILVGERVYVKATVKVSDGENEITTSASAREPLIQKGMNEAQITGSASSYARKYALNGLFCIDDTKDADATNKHGKEDVKAPAKKAPAKTEEKAEEKPAKKAGGFRNKKVATPKPAGEL